MLRSDALPEHPDHESGGSGYVGHEGSPRCLLHGKRHRGASFGGFSVVDLKSRAAAFTALTL